MNEEKYIEETNKKKMPSIVFALIFAALTFAAVFGGIVAADYYISLKDNKTEQENVDKEQESTDGEDVEPSTGADNNETVKAKCSGTYYGEASGTSIKYTFDLKDDGTFTADFSGVSGTHGTYVINGNTISFTQLKEIAGPDESPYETVERYIASDCSYIMYDGDIGLKLMRK